MSPITRSMTEKADREQCTEIVKEIRMGLLNIKRVSGREYKKYLIYALFDYLCEVKEDLHLIGDTFRHELEEKLNYFILDSQKKKNISIDGVFGEWCKYYKIELEDYFR